MAKILVACEESQVVTKEFRKRGHKAFSCDMQECSGGHPEWHIIADLTNAPFVYQSVDCIIAFPPCTHLAVSGAKWFKEKRKDGRQQKAIEFFMVFTKLSCKYVAIENPVSIMSSIYRKPDQIIQPFQFGDSYRKKTCLWLKELPKLIPTKFVDEGELSIFTSGKVLPKWYSDAASHKNREKIRSKMSLGIAQAMAEQWGDFLTKYERRYI